MKIPFTGITKNVTETLKEDGQLDEMINLRHDGAALKTVGTPKDIKFVDTDGNAVSEVEEIVFVHVAADGKNWLSVKDGYLRFYGRENEDGDVIVDPVNVLLLDNDITDISQVGEFVVVKTDAIYFLLYRNAKYTLLNPQEDLNISPLIKGVYGYEVVPLSGEPQTAQESTYLALKCGGTTPSEITKYMGQLRENGCLYNPVFVRLAFKMYDGNYIMHTCPILLRPLRMADSGGFVTYLDYSTNFYATCNIYVKGTTYPPTGFIPEGIVWMCSVFVQYFKIKIKIDKIPGIQKYKDLIESLDVSICEVQQFDYTDTTRPDIIAYGMAENGQSYLYSNFTAVLFPSTGFKERLENASVFRKVKSYTLEELSNGIDEQLDLAKDSILLNLEVQDIVPDDEYSHNKICGNMFLYNQKLHVSNIKTELFGGYELRNFYSKTEDISNSNETSKFSISVLNGFGLVKKIKAASSGIVSDLSDSNYPLALDKIEVLFAFKNSAKSTISKTLRTNDEILQLASFISYPSADVDKIKIKVIFKDSSNKYYMAEQQLEAVSANMMNMSFITNYDKNHIRSCINNGGDGITNTCTYTISETEENYYIRHIYLEQAEPIASDSDYVSENTIVKDNNKIKVSSTANPFYFPVEQTYEIGYGEIRDMAVATQALSPGQFGQFPVYVFCSDGIYALNVGDGEVTYSSTIPVSRDVLTGGLASIDDSIVFISDKKVIVLGGSKTKVISDVLRGDSFRPAIPETDYPIDNMCADAIDDTEFEDFITDAKIYYNYFLREIYLTREGKGYMFVYDRTTGLWGKRTISSTRFIDSYPNLYLQEADGAVKILSSEQLASEAVRHSVFLRTRPMLLSDSGFKKLARLILRTSFTGSVKVRILVSNDGVNYLPLAENYFDADCVKRDIPFRRASASYMYYIVEISGSLSERAYINYIELELEKSIFGNKLR